MTTPESLTPQEAGERDTRLDRWFTEFFALNENHMPELQYLLDKSWMNYVGEHAFSRSRDAYNGPKRLLIPRTEQQIERIRIQSDSEKKQSLLAPIISGAGLEPIMSEATENEADIHERIRRLFRDWQNNYPLTVARFKQPYHETSIPTLTLDTVTYVNGTPLEKPKSLDEARQLIRMATGGEVTTFTSWVLLLQAQSGSTIELLNISKIKYSIQPMSASKIQEYVQTSPNVLSVPIGLDLSTTTARTRFIDLSQPVSFYGKNHLGHEGELRLQSRDLHSGVFNSYFSGVPAHAIASLLPWVNEIYLHGDPVVYEEALAL